MFARVFVLYIVKEGEGKIIMDLGVGWWGANNVLYRHLVNNKRVCNGFNCLQFEVCIGQM